MHGACIPLPLIGTCIILACLTAFIWHLHHTGFSHCFHLAPASYWLLLPLFGSAFSSYGLALASLTAVFVFIWHCLSLVPLNTTWQPWHCLLLAQRTQNFLEFRRSRHSSQPDSPMEFFGVLRHKFSRPPRRASLAPPLYIWPNVAELAVHISFLLRIVSFRHRGKG